MRLGAQPGQRLGVVGVALAARHGRGVGAADSFVQRSERQRLVDEVEHPGAQGIDRHGHVAVTGHDDDLDGVRFGTAPENITGKRKSVPPRHSHVGQDDGDGAGRGLLDLPAGRVRVARRGSGYSLVKEELQDFLDDG